MTFCFNIPQIYTLHIVGLGDASKIHYNLNLSAFVDVVGVSRNVM